MRSKEGYIKYIESIDIALADREIIQGYIEQRNTIRPTAIRTKGKQAYECVWIAKSLGKKVRKKVTLSTATVKDFLRVAGTASSGKFTKDSRQTKISTLKTLARYIHRFHHEIKNLDLLISDVKAGSPEKHRKESLTQGEWHQLLNTPMSPRNRAMIAVGYDGYHRPGELLFLKWSALHLNEQGNIEYDIKFKTEKIRTIVQRPGTTEILEAWRRECGAQIGQDTPIFPAPDGRPYHTITVLAKMFQDLKIKTGIKKLKPSILRNTGMTHDLESGMPIAYVCLRAWGEPFNILINLYTKPNSAKIQRDQHERAGITAGSVLGTSSSYSVQAGDMKQKIADLEKDVKFFKRYIERQEQKKREK